MCNGTYKAATDIPVVVSLSSQSVLRIWNAIDGAFIGECSELYGLLPLAVSMTMLQDKDTLVVCGAGQRAYFVSIGSKQVIAAVRSHRDWITHISTRSLEGETTEEDLARRHHSLLIGDTRTADAYDRDYVTEAVADALGEMPEFVTGSLDGTVAVWGARAFRDRSVAWEITPLLRLHLTQLVGRVEGAHKCLVCADISNDGGMLAVVTVKKWFLVSLAARAHPTVAAVRIPRSSDLLQESEWAGGYFVSNTLFFCWSQLGVGFLYRIEMQAPQRQPQASSPPSPDANTSPNAPLHPSSSSSSPPPPPPPPAAAVPPSKEADENIEIELEHSRRVTPAPSHDHTSDGGSGAEVVWGGNEDKGSIFDDMCYTVRLLYCLDPPVFPVDPAEKGLKTSGWRGSYSKGIFSVANGNNIASWVFPKITEAPILFGGKGIVISDSALLATGHASDGRGPSAEGALPQPAGSVAVSMQQKQQHGLLSSSTSLVISEGDHNALEDDFSTMAQRSYEDQIAMYSSSIDSLRKAKIIRPSATGSFRAGFRGLRNHHHHPSNNSKSSSSSSNSGNDKCEVTCSCLLEDIMMLACGYSNGEVSTTIFQAESVFKCFQAHTKRVTNILAPDPSISKDCRYLITAGDDFCIKVWNVLYKYYLISVSHSFIYFYYYYFVCVVVVVVVVVQHPRTPQKL